MNAYFDILDDFYYKESPPEFEYFYDNCVYMEDYHNLRIKDGILYYNRKLDKNPVIFGMIRIGKAIRDIDKDGVRLLEFSCGNRLYTITNKPIDKI